MEIYRQGDVLLVRVDKAPESTKVAKRQNGRIVLARGESTGHAHTVATRGVKLAEVAASRFLVAESPFVVRHEEHAPVSVPAGTFRVIIQREYSPKEIRTVRD